MHFSTNPQLSKTIQWMDSSMDSWLKCPPFLKLAIAIATTTSISIGVVNSHKVVGSSDSKFFIAKYVASNQAVFSPMYISQNVARPMPS